MKKTNGTINKDWLNNTAIQKKQKTRLNRQVSKFTNSCQSWLTALEILIQSNAEIIEILHPFNYLSVNGNARSMNLCFWGAKDQFLSL